MTEQNNISPGLCIGMVGVALSVGLSLGRIIMNYSIEQEVLPSRMYREDINKDSVKEFVIESKNGKTKYIFTQTGENEYSLLVPREGTRTIYELKKD